MQVRTANDVKVYNLSAGKSLPEWISERKRRALLKNDIELRRRIELIQDFSMPTASTDIQVTSDGQYILATGVYKPRVRCYDVNQLSMKFERCVDSEVVRFNVLSDDYSKFVLLLADRHLEFHAQYGFYYRTRIPKFGRDLVYHYPSCDLYVVGASSEIYRLNLEQGRFMTPLTTSASACNVCEVNPQHQLLTVGTQEGRVECWDPRSLTRVGEMSLPPSASPPTHQEDHVPPVSALRYKNALTLAVGTASGQVLLYDLRSHRPFLTKDHHYSLPIHSISFQHSPDLVLSADSKALRIWHYNNGSPFTAVETDSDINRVCHLMGTGMVFMACEDTKMLSYYIPSLGHAPRWCSFLDSLTEELEEDPEPTVYDDYKFVTSKDLESLGLSHLIGTSMLRAYMHGYFMDLQLYRKAKDIAQPFAYDEYRRERIKQKIEEKRVNRVKEKKLPTVNRQLAERLLEGSKDKSQDTSNPLGDDRFAAMFTNPNFQVDEESEEFQMLHPVLAKAMKKKQEKKTKKEEEEEEEEEELEGRPSDESSSSSEDEEVWREAKRRQRMAAPAVGDRPGGSSGEKGRVEMVAVSGRGGTLREVQKGANVKVSLGKRLEMESVAPPATIRSSLLGNKEMKVTLKKSDVETNHRKQLRDHRAERKRLGRSARSILPKQHKLPVFWKGRRIK